MEIFYTPAFVRQLKSLESDLCEEALGKIEEFKDSRNHERLKVHKLKGSLKPYHSFSVDYKNRILFRYLSKSRVVLVSVGDHKIYKA